MSKIVRGTESAKIEQIGMVDAKVVIPPNRAKINPTRDVVLPTVSNASAAYSSLAERARTNASNTLIDARRESGA